MFYLKIPGEQAISAFITQQKPLDFTYAERKSTALTTPVKGFDNDAHRVKIGQGIADFDKAKQAIAEWAMFPSAWTKIKPDGAPIVEGTTVAMFAAAFGGWWRNACRIIYVVDEPQRYGFAYGTLPGHIETGEELFLVEMDAEGGVWYSIKAFSRPYHWIAKMAYPIMRWFQARFRRDSGKSMHHKITTL